MPNENTSNFSVKDIIFVPKAYGGAYGNDVPGRYST